MDNGKKEINGTKTCIYAIKYHHLVPSTLKKQLKARKDISGPK